MTESPREWFGVRCLFEHDATGTDEVSSRAFEERVTIWKAAGPDEAIEFAEADATEYASILGALYLGLAQAYRIDGRPKQGAEVFSLIRDSDLGPSDYLDAFFDTGREYQRTNDTEP